MTDEKDELEVYFEGEDHPISTEPETVSEESDEPTQVENEQETVPDSEPTAETTQEVPSVPEGYAPIAALQDERRKAQQAREEAEMLRRQVPIKDEAPDPYEDIDAYNAYIRNKTEQEIYQKLEQQRIKNIEESRMKMLEKYQDYDEMEQIFSIMTATNIDLVEKMNMSSDPAKFAYDTAKAYKASLLSPSQGKLDVDLVQPPIKEVPNLAKATAQAPNTPQVEPEATIDDIFADMQY